MSRTKELSNHRPYLSVVATARNDNHGGDLLGRMQHFVDAFTEQCQRFHLDAELIIVEWNPPIDRQPLSSALNWSAVVGRHRCSTRIIEVPNLIHRRFKHAEQLPLYQMIAKNVGIRRAHGDYILATNIDILFTDELIAYLASKPLQYQSQYRIDRWDIDPAPPLADAVPVRLEWCRENVIRRHTKYDSVDQRNGATYPVAWHPTWRVRLLEWLQDNDLVPIVTRPPLHLNGCGDFTLLHRDHWHALRGYAQFEMYSMHLDSIFCTAAHVLGLQEVILDDPFRIYHLEHGTGSGFKPEAVEALENRLQKSGITSLTMADFQKLALEMRRNKRPTIFNDDDWGLAHESLREINPASPTENIDPANSTPPQPASEPCAA